MGSTGRPSMSNMSSNSPLLDSESSDLDDDIDRETLKNTIANRLLPSSDSGVGLMLPPAPAQISKPRRVRIASASNETQTAIESPIASENQSNFNGNSVSAASDSAKGFSETVSNQPATPPIAHMAHTCAGLHGANSRTLVERRSFDELFGECDRIVIPVFQRAYCWSQTTTVPAWWRDTAVGPRHSCGKIVLKQHADGSHWCLDGQQRLTTTLLLVAAARDVLLQLDSPADDSLKLCNAALYRDVSAALAAGSSQLTINDGEHVSFCRLTPSFVDRKPFYELICQGIGGVVASSTLSSVQAHTKRYFEHQFGFLVRGLRPDQAVTAVHDRVVSALSMQLMLIEPLSANNSTVSQIYQWLQESPLLSMGSLLFNPTPGLTMCAADLCRNLCVAPFLDESWDDVERIFNSGWLNRVELPCGGDPRKIDALLAVVIDRCSPLTQCNVEQQLLAAQAFLKKDLPGLRLYGRIVSLWRRDEEELAATASGTALQRLVATRFIERLASSIY